MYFFENEQSFIIYFYVLSSMLLF